ALPGWTSEGNIYWSKNIFERLEHGAEAVGHVEPDRRLFWARLQLREARSTIFVSTAHLTAPRRSDQPEAGMQAGVGQRKRISEVLSCLPREGEPAFFMGDMNDAWHPQRILKRVGFIGSFAALGLQSPPTFQCYPTAGVEPGEPTITEAIDLIVANKHAC